MPITARHVAPAEGYSELTVSYDLLESIIEAVGERTDNPSSRRACLRALFA